METEDWGSPLLPHPVRAAVGQLVNQQFYIERDAGFRASAVMLPRDEFPAELTGDGAQILGLPVVWGDRIALMYEVL